MAVGDFNSDNMLDVVVADTAYSALHLLKGNGDGNFQPAFTTQQWNYLGAVAVGDFNNDNHADLLVTLWEWESVSAMSQVH
jgi:hypothetical protein